MVEGPQCHLKARKLQGAGLVGQRVLRAVCPGNATLAARLASAGPILRIVAVGKECFFVFADCALRLHFAMSGSQVIRNGPAPPLPRGSRKVLTLTLELQSGCAVDVFDASNPTVRTLGYLANVESRAGRDVIADEFERQSVIELLRGDPRLALDALMDQQTFPGVGNVIKCEGLHEACVSPTIVLSELPAARLGLLVDTVRAFAQRWHDACRRGVAISKRIYGSTVCACGQEVSLSLSRSLAVCARVCVLMPCRLQVGLVRAGEKNRITYFCAKCQSREASLRPQIPRRSGTLLGWLQGSNAHRGNCPAPATSAHMDQGVQGAEPAALEGKWPCSRCTLLNHPAAQRCGACRGPRDAGSTAAAEASTGASSTQVEAHCSGSAKRMAADSPYGPDDAANTGKRHQPTERMPPRAGNASLPAAGVRHDGGLRLAAPACRCSAKAKLQRVRKAGANHGRLFWSCPKRQGQGCGAFIWADERFPSCLCTANGRKKALLRRVLKAGPSNGRYFFSCAGGGGGTSKNAKPVPGKTPSDAVSGDGCGFFSWESEQLQCWDAAAAPVALPL